MTLTQGQTIGDYRIEHVLGSGGMGVVYVAMDMRLGRRAAIKQLLPALSGDRDIVERFFNEAKAAASINHPSIVEIYDVGWHADGSAFFAMKLLEGESIARRLRASGPIPVEIASTIARQVATALGAAHARGIVHRDLKPDNIMLVRDDEVVIGERAIILDFGIAKLFVEGVEQSKTRTGVFMGTPAYMSPEQCRGAGDVDARTDVYALGCIVFEMLTGRPPFIGQGSGEIVGMHQYVAPPALRSLRADVPEGLEALVMKSLEKDPAKRVQSMMEFAHALSPFAVQALHSQPGITRLSVPPAVMQASTYSAGRGEISKPPAVPSRRVLPILTAVLGVALIVTIVLLAKGGSGNHASQTPGDATTWEAGDKVAVLRTQVKKAIVERRWLDVQAMTQKWSEAAPNDNEATELAHKALLEAGAERARDDLREALNEKDAMKGLGAYDRIPQASVYRDEAIDMMGKLRAHWITTQVPVARRLAAAHDCKALQQLAANGSQLGGGAYEAVTQGIQCTEEPKQ